MSERPASTRFKVCTWIALSVLVPVMAWQCVTRPVEEVGGARWVTKEFEANAALNPDPIERPPTVAEVAVRGMACATSLLTGLALVRFLRSKG
jgi:hypothetical protein